MCCSSASEDHFAKIHVSTFARLSTTKKQRVLHIADWLGIQRPFLCRDEAAGMTKRLPRSLPTSSPLGLDSRARGELEQVKRDAGGGRQGKERRPLTLSLPRMIKFKFLLQPHQ